MFYPAIIPCRGQMWIGGKAATAIGGNAQQAGKHQIAEGGMVVILSPLIGLTWSSSGCQLIPGNPMPIEGVQIFVNPGLHRAVRAANRVGRGVLPQQAPVIRPGESRLRFPATQQFCAGRQQLRCGKRPGRAVPQTFMIMVLHEPRMPPLRRGGAKGRGEALRGEQLPECLRPARRRGPIWPRQIPRQLPDIML